MMAKSPPGKSSKTGDSNQVPPAEFLRAWLQQSALFWSRLQTLTVISAATFASWFALFCRGHHLLARATLFLALIVVFIIGAVMLRDRQFMEFFKSKCPELLVSELKPVVHGQLLAGILIIMLLLALLTLLAFGEHFFVTTTASKASL